MQARVYDVIEQDLLEEEMEAIALFEYMQLLKQGVTRVFDGGAVNGSIPAQKRALERLGMRGVLDADSLLPDFAGQDSPQVSLCRSSAGRGGFDGRGPFRRQIPVRPVPEADFRKPLSGNRLPAAAGGGLLRQIFPGTVLEKGTAVPSKCAVSLCTRRRKGLGYHRQKRSGRGAQSRQQSVHPAPEL